MKKFVSILEEVGLTWDDRVYIYKSGGIKLVRNPKAGSLPSTKYVKSLDDHFRSKKKLEKELEKNCVKLAKLDFFSLGGQITVKDYELFTSLFSLSEELERFLRAFNPQIKWCYSEKGSEITLKFPMVQDWEETDQKMKDFYDSYKIKRSFFSREDTYEQLLDTLERSKEKFCQELEEKIEGYFSGTVLPIVVKKSSRNFLRGRFSSFVNILLSRWYAIFKNRDDQLF